MFLHGIPEEGTVGQNDDERKSDKLLTSWSTPARLPRNGDDQSCTNVRYQEQVDRPGWDLSTWSKSTATLCTHDMSTR